MLYDANYDKELLKERAFAKDLCFEFNHTRPSDETKQKEILDKLIGKTHGAYTITAPFYCD